MGAWSVLNHYGYGLHSCESIQISYQRWERGPWFERVLLYNFMVMQISIYQHQACPRINMHDGKLEVTHFSELPFSSTRDSASGRFQLYEDDKRRACNEATVWAWQSDTAWGMWRRRWRRYRQVSGRPSVGGPLIAAALPTAQRRGRNVGIKLLRTAGEKTVPAAPTNEGFLNGRKLLFLHHQKVFFFMLFHAAPAKTLDTALNFILVLYWPKCTVLSLVFNHEWEPLLLSSLPGFSESATSTTFQSPEHRR